jgi:Lysophospholipase L1 and related esterases
MKNILCYGDSNTFGSNPHGGRWERHERWTGILQEKLGPDYYVIEEGLGGRTTVFTDPLEPCRNGLEALPYSLYTHRPIDLVIVMLGTNDTKVMYNATPRVIGKGMETILKTIRNHDFGIYRKPELLLISPILIGEKIADVNFASFDETSHEKSLKIAPWAKEAAMNTGAYYLNAANYVGPSPIDQLHMEAEDHKRLAAAIELKVKEIFKEI